MEESKKASNENLQLERGIGKMAAIMLCFNGIVGSGIFVSPKGILEAAGTPGFSMIMWVICGVLATFGALCYVEIGCVIPKTGGEYPVLDHVYGPTPAFLFAWLYTSIMGPASMSVSCITFAKYLISIFHSNEPCKMQFYEKVIAVCTAWLAVSINSYSMKLTNSVSKVFGYIKIASLSAITIIGLYALTSGSASLEMFHLDQSFKNQNGDVYFPSLEEFGIGLFSGAWAFNGWNKLNYIIEEIKEPEKNLLIAVVGSLGMVSIFYMAVNLSYFAVLGIEGILYSNAVATDFAATIFPSLRNILPGMVACSCLGMAMIQCLVSGRIPFAAARRGQMPKILSMIHIDYKTPLPSLLTTGIFSTFLISFNDVGALLKYFGFVTWSFYTLVFLAVIITRRRNPEIERTFSVPIAIPYLMVLFGSYLVFNVFYTEFSKIGTNQAFDFGYFYVILFSLIGLLVHFLQHNLKPMASLTKISKSITRQLQLLLIVAPEKL